MQNSNARREHAKQFLAGLILVGLAGSVTIWWLIGWPLAMAYAAGFSTPIIFAKVAPSYTPPPESEPEPPDRGYR